MTNPEQPSIHPDLLQRLRFIAACYEMTAEKMLNLIVTVSLEELDGRQDECTVIVPTDLQDETP